LGRNIDLNQEAKRQALVDSLSSTSRRRFLAGITEGGTAFLIGAILTAVAVVVWRQAKPTYSIFFGTAGGERRALVSEDGSYVERVARAIDEALIAGR
jgi:ferric-dicitrate binding protein FerR (iron transport regulator)